MGYQLKKKKHINKSLDLIGDDGKVEKTLTVDIVVDDFRNRYPKVMADVKKAQAMLDSSGETDVEAVVASEIAVKAVFVLIFGEIQTREFLQYYENRYSEAFLDVIPFITDEIIPAVKKAVEQENNRIQSVMK
jgi:S-adenosylmethionine synthetase